MSRSNALYLAEESTYKIATTLVEAYHYPATTAEAKDDIIAGANLISRTIKALDSENVNESTSRIVKELEKHKDTQGHYGLLAKIKEFIKSIINLLKSTFTQRTAEEFRKSTDDTIQEIVASTYNKASQRSTNAPLPKKIIDHQK